MKFRTGRKVGRTLYVQIGDQPDDMDLLIGIVDSSDQADIIVNAVNAVERIRELHRPHDCTTDHMNPHTPTPCVHAGTCIGCGAGYGPCPTIRILEGQ